MSNRIKSIKGLFGQIIHYKDDIKVGESWPGLFSGSLNHYDAKGKYVGHSAPGIVTDMIHYNERGRYMGESHSGFLGNKKHFDADRNYVGETWNGFTGDTTEFMERDGFADDSDHNDFCDCDEW